jgi:pSer/pThr/pTyr-binding forkhead associated (FHA) protein
MPKLTLQFEDRILKDYVVGANVTIGRLPDNTIVIDNPAVSAHHARIFREGDDVIIEDLESTNGTYVNEQHVYRHRLQHGDVVLIGKHKLRFDLMADAMPSAAEPVMSGLGDTVYLDTQRHRAMLASLRQARANADRAAGTRPMVAPIAPSRSTVGVLRVVDGPMTQEEYNLEAHTSLIGKSKTSLVRLRGWFKPDVAVAIARTGDDYVATQLGGKTLINSKPLTGRHHLKDGDVLYVSGMVLQFAVRNTAHLTPSGGHERLEMHRFMSSGERAATVRALT